MEDKSEISLHKERLGLSNKEDQQKISKAKLKALRQDFAFCFNSPEGRRVLKFMMNIGGYRKNKIGGNPQLGMDVTIGTLYNTSREQLLIEIFEFIPAYLLRDAEYGIDEDLEV